MMDNRELTILEIISRTSEPIGSWFIVNEFEEIGITISSATIGRLLNLLEKRGFLKKHGIKGRTITELGKKTIKMEYKSLKLEEHKKTLDELINSNVLHKFLMVLEARKAIERTTARLAAEHISNEELDKLRINIEKQQTDYEDNNSIAQDDIDFHRTIALASRNEALYSLYMMLSLMGQQSELFEELRKRVNRHYMSAHKAIYEALKEHSPEKAEISIVNHLDQLALDVNTYWNDVNNKKQ
jgi:GntR family transcriptional regulator, transcriptional repressor for pyruvate dehydrogenase complex